MSDQPAQPENDAGLVVVTQPDQQGEQVVGESVSEPAKVMRIGAMVRQLLEEVRQAPLDEAGRIRLREIYELSVKELAEGLSPELRDELAKQGANYKNMDVEVVVFFFSKGEGILEVRHWRRSFRCSFAGPVHRPRELRSMRRARFGERLKAKG